MHLESITRLERGDSGHHQSAISAMVRTRSHAYHLKQILDVSNRFGRHCMSRAGYSVWKAEAHDWQIMDSANQISVAVLGFARGFPLQTFVMQILEPSNHFVSL